MTYTLDMASDLEPHVAADGIQEVPLTKARALLTRLIEQVREEGLVSALTVRGRRRAYLVTPDFYEQAQSDRRMVAAFHGNLAKFQLEGDIKALVTSMGRDVMEAEDRDAARAKEIADFYASD